MSTLEDHKQFLAKKDYPLKIGYPRISTKDTLLLSKYGYWLEALSSGIISPLTPEQSRFIDVSNGTQEAISDFEKAWHNLQAILKEEQTPLFRPSSPPFEYFPCPECGSTETQKGVPCVACRIKSGKIVRNTDDYVQRQKIRNASRHYIKPVYGHGSDGDNWDYSAIK